MTRKVIIALCLTLPLLLGARAISSQQSDLGLGLADDIRGTPPPKAVDSWIRLSFLGVRNHLYPVVWLSSHTFVRADYERLVVLSPANYQRALTTIQSYDCLDPRTGYHIALLAAQYSRARGIRTCRIRYPAACQALSSLSMIPSTTTSVWKEPPIRELYNDMGCRS
jgi:hypothetical protein